MPEAHVPLAWPSEPRAQVGGPVCVCLGQGMSPRLAAVCTPAGWLPHARCAATKTAPA